MELGMPEHKTAEAQITTDHDEIRKWAESRGGKPAAVKATHRGKDPGIIRLIFPDAANADDESLEEISWAEYFRKFDEAGLAPVCCSARDTTSGLSIVSMRRSTVRGTALQPISTSASI